MCIPILESYGHEHSPLGGDELNLIHRGANYGWPVISYGWQYSGGPIGMGITAHEGMEQPVWVWTPAIAPSGMIVYTGAQFAPGAVASSSAPCANTISIG